MQDANLARTTALSAPAAQPPLARNAPRRAALSDSTRPLSIRTYLIGCAAVLILAALARWLLVLRYYLLPNSDQVMVGLMARHILAGEHPAFYWGQSYNGTLESYFTAAVFRLWGSSYQALHVAPLAFSLLFVGAMVALCRRLYGERLALLCGTVLALGPALLIEFSVSPGYNYVQVMALGTLALVLALPAQDGPFPWWRLPPIAFLLGLALWAQPLALTYLLAVLAALIGPAGHAWRRATERRALLAAAVVALPAATLALWPAISFNLHARQSTLHFLVSQPRHLHLTLLEELRRLLFWAGPVLLGLIPPSEEPTIFQHLIAEHAALYLAAALLMALTVLSLAVRWRMLLGWLASLRTRRPAAEAPLVVLAGGVLCAFLFSSWSTSRWSATEPRYLLPLYTLTPLALRALWPPRAALWRRCLAGAFLAALMYGGLAANAAAMSYGDLQPLAARLEARGIGAVYGDYWTVYRLAFVSDERLIPVATNPNLTLGFNRYPPYLRLAAVTPRVAWLVPRRPGDQTFLLRCLRRQHRAYRHWSLGALAIYDQITPPLHSCTPHP